MPQEQASKKEPVDYKAVLLRQIHDRGLTVTQSDFIVQGSRRRWRFDWLIGQTVAVEYDGVFSKHTNDAIGEVVNITDRFNETQVAGFTCIRANQATVRDESAANQIVLAFKREQRITEVAARPTGPSNEELADLKRLANGLVNKLDKILSR